MFADELPHRFLILTGLLASPTRKGAAMLDLVMLAVGLVLFAISIGYAYACDRL